MGYYGTKNKFLAENVTDRYKFICNELIKRNIRPLVFGSDGDCRFVSAQKKLINFGDFFTFGPMKLAGNLNSEVFGSQDTSHIMNRLKNSFFDLTHTKILGNYHASVNHLIIMIKMFNKSDHHLVPTDLDMHNKLNYKYVSNVFI